MASVTKALLFAGLLVCGGLQVAHSGPPANFDAAKALMRRVYADFRYDVYCGCKFDHASRVSSSCPVASATYRDRLSRIEWEHVVPAADFGRQLACWRSAPQGTSGREHCRVTDDRFRAMEADPHNLMPAIGALNAVRSAYRYGEVPGERRAFGACDFEISADGEGRFVEPPQWIKGDVARTYYYFEAVWGHRIGGSQRRLLDSWAAADPPDAWEFERALRIERATGLANPILRGVR